jgi:hypothetical protein
VAQVTEHKPWDSRTVQEGRHSWLQDRLVCLAPDGRHMAESSQKDAIPLVVSEESESAGAT